MRSIAFLQKWPMDTAQRSYWLRQLSSELPDALIGKFQRGQKSHGGTDLGELETEQLIEEMLMEALDQINYLSELKRRMIPYGDGVYLKRTGVLILLELLYKHAGPVTPKQRELMDLLRSISTSKEPS